MKYTIDCGYCDKGLTVMGTDEEDGMKRMIEEAKAHNSLRHPEERELSDEDLKKEIKAKWRKEV